jgi:cytidylate kinase
MIIAIDGPAASGKGTIARQLAAVYGLHHLDTGLLYRAVAKAMLDAGYPPDDV